MGRTRLVLVVGSTVGNGQKRTKKTFRMNLFGLLDSFDQTCLGGTIGANTDVDKCASLCPHLENRNHTAGSGECAHFAGVCTLRARFCSCSEDLSEMCGGRSRKH